MEKFKFYTVLSGLIFVSIILQACGGGGGGGTPVVTPEGVSLNSIGSKLVAPGATLTFTVSASNPDSNSISFSSNSSHAIYMSQGASFNPATGQFSWTPSAEGSHQITFSVTNNDVTPAVTDSETITIEVTSRVQLNAIGNKTVGPNGTLTFTVSAFNPDNNSVTLSADLSQASGATFNPANGLFSWTPSAEGSHDVIFTVTNNDAPSVSPDTETITITVANRVQLNAIGNKTVGPGGTLNFTVSASNPDSNSISLSTDTHDIYTSQGAMFNSTTGEFSWVPTVLGDHQITFLVTNDDVAVSDSETITISVSNRVQLNSIGSKTVTTGDTLSFSVTASNPDNNSISYSTDETHTIYASQNAIFNSATGQFSWTPAVAGNHSVSFTVTNNDVLPVATDSETISINVQDVATVPPSVLVLGADRYSTNCESCHGPNGEGGPNALFGVVGSSPFYVRDALTLGAMSGVNVSTSEANAIGYFLCDRAGIDINDTLACEP